MGTATATGYQATVNANRTIAGTLGTATATGYQATVNANRTIAGALGTATATGFQATVNNTNNTVINGALGTAAAIGYTANINANRTIAGALGTAAATGFQATVVAGGAASYVSNAELYLGIGSDLSIRLGGPRMPFWNTAGRPAAPLDGVYGYNTTTGAIEVWNGSAWV